MKASLMHRYTPIPSEHFASRLMQIVDSMTDALGMGAHPDFRTGLYILLVIAIAIISGMLARWLIIYVVRRVMMRHLPVLYKELSDNHVLRHTGKLIPPLVFLSLIPFAFSSDHKGTHVIITITLIYTIIIGVIALNSFLNFVWTHYNSHHNDERRPLRGILDISKGAMWTVAVIIIISIIIDRSPLALLTGLGAFAAVLLLIFKNSILGLVSGIEISDNDMLRVGDWIQIPDKDVNGIVIDVSLVVVKVRNWNHTVSMVPASSLISTTFVNWRYMQESGTRQILMSVPIDVSTVCPPTDDQLHTLQQQLPLLKDYIDIKLKQRAEGKTQNVFNKEAGVAGTIDTNLGLLRAYVNLYLKQHPYIYNGALQMVRILQPTPQGFPLQVFAYTTTSVWADYEAIMADIFEHIVAVAPMFGLAVFQAPSGRMVYDIGRDPINVPYTGTSPVTTATADPSTNATPGFK